MKQSCQLIIPLILGVIVALLDPPAGLTRAAMIYMGVFICVIFWLVFNLIPDFVVTTLALAIFVFTHVATTKVAFSPFASSSVWLVIGAFGISAVVARTGLLKRISFLILRCFPENFQGQILALFTTGFVISPLIPSLTAKGSILAPFAAEAAKALGFEKGSKGARGMFAATWISAGIFGCAFLSGAVPVFTILGFLPQAEQADFTWMRWFEAACVWLLIVAVLSYVAVMILCKPANDGNASNNKGFARQKLEALGPMSRDEKLTLFFLLLALFGWMVGKWLKLDSGVWAVFIMCLMFAFKLMPMSDFGSKISWRTIVFIGGVFSLAAQISVLKIDKWLATILGPTLEPLLSSPYILIPAICLATYALRCVVISQTATTAIFFAMLGGVSEASGINTWVVLFVCYMSTLVWHFSFTNVTYVATLGATGGDMVDHKDTVPMNFAYMIINLIACTASIPLWQFMGLIH